MSKVILNAIKLTRPFNCLSSLSGVLIGGLIVEMPGPIRLWIAGIVAALITAGGNVVNDYVDIEIDRINKPTRVLPSGGLSKSFAAWFSIILFGAALTISLTLGKVMAAYAAIMVSLSLLYSIELKKTFLFGNFVIGLMTAGTLYYGSIAVGDLRSAWSPAVIVFSFMLGREILKTVEDYEGDIKIGATTIAILWGKKTAIWLFSGFMVLVIFLIPIPWLIREVSFFYILLTIPFVGIVLIGSIFFLFIRPGKESIHKALIVTKTAWFSWAIAMFIGLGLKF